MHGWTEQEYLLWLQKHDDEKVHWDLLEKSVEDQLTNPSSLALDRKVNGGTQGSEEAGEEMYVRLVRTVLEHARKKEVHTPL